MSVPAPVLMRCPRARSAWPNTTPTVAGGKSCVGPRMLRLVLLRIVWSSSVRPLLPFVFQRCEQLVPSSEFVRRFFLVRQQLAPEFIRSLQQRRVQCTVLFRRQWFRVVGHFGILRHVVRQPVAFRFTRAAVLVG